MPIVVDFCSIGDRCSCGWWVLDLRTLGQSRGTEMSLGLFQQYTNIFIKVESAAVTSTNWAKVNWCLKFDSHGKPNMKSFLMKFVSRINGGINFYFVCCWDNRFVREQYVVITSGLADVASFCSSLFCSKKCGCGVSTV